MAERGANIDLLFRNGLSDYEALPPPDVWEGIHPVMPGQKRSYLPLRIAASVVVLAASGLLTAMLVRNLPSEAEKPVFTIAVDDPPVVIKKENPPNTAKPLMNAAIAATGSEKPAEADKLLSETTLSYYSLPSPGLYTSFTPDRKKIADTEPGKGIVRPGPLNRAYNPAWSDNSADAEIRTSEAVTEKENRWSVGAMVSPAYYSQLDLSQDQSGNDLANSEESAFSYTGGLTFAYNLSSRFTVQTGVSFSSIGQRIEGVSSFSGFEKYFQTKGAGEFQVATSSGTIKTSNSDIYLFENTSGSRVMSMFTRDVFDPNKNELSYISSSLMQNFNYLEVPVVLKYKFIDRNVDLKLIGGVSYNVLVNNSAYTTSGGTKYYIGKTDGLSPVTLSSSLGMGMEYSFSGRLSLNLEPTFRYYITPLGGMAGSSIHPYSFGVLSGISYKF
jgi:hypothetical protein